MARFSNSRVTYTVGRSGTRYYGFKSDRESFSLSEEEYNAIREAFNNPECVYDATRDECDNIKA